MRMTRVSLRAALLLVVVSALAACETTPPRPTYPPIRFNDLPPIRLDVARVEVVEEYRSPGVLPNVEQLFPERPAAAAAQWARDRLRAVGTRARAEAIIRQASVVEVPLKTSAGLAGAFTTEQSERYDGILEMVVRILDDSGKQLASAYAKSTLSRSVAENITLNDREKLWYDMTVSMMRTVNDALERQIRQNLVDQVR